LIDAAFNGREEALRLLVAAGASLKTEVDGWTALHYANKQHHAVIWRFLIEEGKAQAEKIVAAAAAGRPQLVRFATPNKDVPVPAGVAKAIWDAAANKDNIEALTPLCEQWAGNTQAIDGHRGGVSR